MEKHVEKKGGTFGRVGQVYKEWQKVLGEIGKEGE